MIEIIQDITKMGCTLTFSQYCNDVIQVTYYDQNGIYVRHEMIGHPDCSYEYLKNRTEESLLQFLENIKNMVKTGE